MHRRPVPRFVTAWTGTGALAMAATSAATERYSGVIDTLFALAGAVLVAAAIRPHRAIAAAGAAALAIAGWTRALTAAARRHDLGPSPETVTITWAWITAGAVALMVAIVRRGVRGGR